MSDKQQVDPEKLKKATEIVKAWLEERGETDFWHGSIEDRAQALVEHSDKYGITLEATWDIFDWGFGDAANEHGS